MRNKRAKCFSETAAEAFWKQLTPHGSFEDMCGVRFVNSEAACSVGRACMVRMCVNVRARLARVV